MGKWDDIARKNRGMFEDKSGPDASCYQCAALTTFITAEGLEHSCKNYAWGGMVKTEYHKFPQPTRKCPLI